MKINFLSAAAFVAALAMPLGASAQQSQTPGGRGHHATTTPSHSEALASLAKTTRKPELIGRPAATRSIINRPLFSRSSRRKPARSQRQSRASQADHGRDEQRPAESIPPGDASAPWARASSRRRPIKTKTDNSSNTRVTRSIRAGPSNDQGGPQQGGPQQYQGGPGPYQGQGPPQGEQGPPQGEQGPPDQGPPPGNAPPA